ncbi:MAG: NifU family protein [Patescibacteria group bacterium]
MNGPFLTDTSTTERKINMALDKIRPYIQSHGGNVRLVRHSESSATLLLDGTCADCPLANLTYNKVIKTVLEKEVPKITNLVLVTIT